jgi:hypothetical protein
MRTASRFESEPVAMSRELLDWKYGNPAAVLPVIFEAHATADLGEQRMVLAEPDVQARLEAAPLLTHEDRSAWYDIAVVALDAEPLRVAVAAVP